MFLGLPILNKFESKKDIVHYLNSTGKFWEYCNDASEDISDEEVIEKGLLYLEFEDMEQMFDIFGKKRCKAVFENNLEKTKSSYNNIIVFLLRNLFFKKDESK